MTLEFANEGRIEGNLSAFGKGSAWLPEHFILTPSSSDVCGLGCSLEASTHTANLKLSKCLREAGPFTGLETEGRKLSLFQVTELECEPREPLLLSSLV